MKRIIIALSFIAASTQISSAVNHPAINMSYRNAIKKNVDVKDFIGVAAGGPLTVVVTLGNTEGVRFEGDQEAISTLITEVKGNVLIIRPQTSWTSWAHKYEGKKITAYVSAKTIKTLTMSGDGSLTVKGKITENSLTTTLSGSGKITANAEVSNYTGVISGSGNLYVSGSADHASITISGSGSFTQKGFETGKLQAAISGSGNISITANETINAAISGSGSINYSGDAEVSKRVVGSGRVRKV